jgi:hypothetical protein
MFKKSIKRGIIKVRDFIWSLQEERNEKHDYDQDDFAYPWLNSILTKLLSDEDGAALRPHFLWGVLQGACLAKAVGIDRVSVMELGVAGGNGLISLERVAEKIEGILEVKIDVYGFDTGAGLPKSQDHRDLPNLWAESAFPMDFQKLKQRLKRAQLLLGLVQESIPRFIDSTPAPVAFVSFDLDYYSSTMQAFKLLEADPALLLPRIHCYFDDIIGFTFSDYNGERLAIREFNDSHRMRKISPIYGLKYLLPASQRQEAWVEQFYMAHIFDHDLYGRPDGLVKRALGSSTDLKVKMQCLQPLSVTQMIPIGLVVQRYLDFIDLV